MTLSIRLFLVLSAAALAFALPAYADSPATAAICKRTLPVDFIVGYPGDTPAEGKSQWDGTEKAALAKSLTVSLAKLCKQKLVTPMMFHDDRQVVFIENDNANVISLWSIDQRSADEEPDKRWKPGTLYVEVPQMESFTPKGLDPEMRRAILCSYNFKEAVKADETACMSD
jgi:hypothetical protein